MTVREPSLDTMRRDATVIAAGRLPQGVDPERGAMREQRRLIAAVEQHQRVPQVLVGIGQPFLPGLMPYRDRPGRMAVLHPGRLVREAGALHRDAETGSGSTMIEGGQHHRSEEKTYEPQELMR